MRRTMAFASSRARSTGRVLKAKRDAYVKGINDWYVTFLADSSIDRIDGRRAFRGRAHD